MLIKQASALALADITPKEVYWNRRNFLRGLGIAGAATVVGERFSSLLSPPTTAFAGTKLTTIKSNYRVDDKISSENDVTHYNNFYEFDSDKDDPAMNAQNFRTSPWVVSVEGEVKTPRKFSMDEILTLAPLEERIYSHCCVERWSSLVPWLGNCLRRVPKLAYALPEGKQVPFEIL